MLIAMIAAMQLVLATMQFYPQTVSDGVSPPSPSELWNEYEPMEEPEVTETYRSDRLESMTVEWDLRTVPLDTLCRLVHVLAETDAVSCNVTTSELEKVTAFRQGTRDTPPRIGRITIPSDTYRFKISLDDGADHLSSVYAAFQDTKVESYVERYCESQGMTVSEG